MFTTLDFDSTVKYVPYAGGDTNGWYMWLAVKPISGRVSYVIRLVETQEERKFLTLTAAVEYLNSLNFQVLDKITL